MNGVGRDAIKDGFFQQMAEEGERLGLIRRCTPEEREASWRHILATNPNECGSVWIFAYGSLLWNPAFHLVDRVDGRLFGYHRSFCLRTYIGRGSPEQPGLVLGLEAGGSCCGQALKVDPTKLEEELDVIWSREMVSGAYHPRWVSLKTDQGDVPSVAFVMDQDYDNYAGDLSFEEKCHDLAHAQGALGYASDYLYETVAAMDKMGFKDKMLDQCVKRVKEIQSDNK
ncbi:gamma-glutamylcyclotransferase [Curvivirga aplysinae]|uniref:gamma-glutamylcyclotransferase n=1 Tax=Curvivirga aplysinae TaxID=2529852 RepID=UPI0012BCEF8A|nr:gamma-glutamylcyclotransferase [Curvivirga aplysinae]MTI09992.1 gamma-glutamylcyclotransferase [Curvivirga aplysinae]